MKMKIELAAIQAMLVLDLKTSRSDPKLLVAAINTTAVRKPKTIRHTTISKGPAKPSIEMIRGKLPQIR
jgi:hypothetical protein